MVTGCNDPTTNKAVQDVILLYGFYFFCPKTSLSGECRNEINSMVFLVLFAIVFDKQ